MVRNYTLRGFFLILGQIRASNKEGFGFVTDKLTPGTVRHIQFISKNVPAGQIEEINNVCFCLRVVIIIKIFQLNGACAVFIGKTANFRTKTACGGTGGKTEPAAGVIKTGDNRAVITAFKCNAIHGPFQFLHSLYSFLVRTAAELPPVVCFISV